MADGGNTAPPSAPPSAPDAMSRQEAMEKFGALDSSIQTILGILSAQSQHSGQAAVSGSNTSTTGSSGSAIVAEQGSHPHPATAPSFLQISQENASAALPAQSVSAAVGLPPEYPWFVLGIRCFNICYYG